MSKEYERLTNVELVKLTKGHEERFLVADGITKGALMILLKYNGGIPIMEPQDGEALFLCYSSNNHVYKIAVGDRRSEDFKKRFYLGYNSLIVRRSVHDNNDYSYDYIDTMVEHMEKTGMRLFEDDYIKEL